MQYIFSFRKEDSLPTRDKMSGPKVSFTQRFHCNDNNNNNENGIIKVYYGWTIEASCEYM